MRRGDPDGIEKLTRALELAHRARLPEQVGNTHILLGIAVVQARSHTSATEYLDTGIRYCSEHGLELYRLYLLAYRARSELDQGQWGEAADNRRGCRSRPAGIDDASDHTPRSCWGLSGRGGEIPASGASLDERVGTLGANGSVAADRTGGGGPG